MLLWALLGRRTLLLVGFCLSLMMASSSVLGGPPSKARQRVMIARWIKQLSSPQWKQRVHAVRALSTLQQSAASAVPALLPLMQDEHPEVRGATAYAFGMIGAAAAPAIPTLLRGMRDKHPWVRGFSAFAMAKMGPRAAQALSRMLSQKHLESRVLAAIALSRTPYRAAAWDAATLAALYQTPAVNTSWVRFYAIQALRKMRSLAPATLQVLLRSLGDRHHRVRAASLQAISAFGSAAQTAIPTLLAMRKGIISMERRLAIRSLSYIGKGRKDVVAALKQDYVDPKYTIRWEAWQGLQRLGFNLPKPPLRHTTTKATQGPSTKPTSQPASRPTKRLLAQPTSKASAKPVSRPTSKPASNASAGPVSRPTRNPSARPVNRQ